MNQNNQTNPQMNQNQPNAHYQQKPITPQVNYVTQPIVRRFTKNKFFTFCFSLIPGVVQMYHGLMKRGVSIMALFFGVIAVSATLYLPVLTFLLPIIWFYSFFDGVNRMNYSLDELKAVKDTYFIDFHLEPNNRLQKLLKNRHLFIGWVIILIGAYALLNIMIFSNYSLWNSLFEPYVYQILSTIMNTIPRIAIPIVCLIIGVKLIKGEKEKEKQSDVSEITTITTSVNSDVQ